MRLIHLRNAVFVSCVFGLAGAGAAVQITQAPGQAELGTVEIHGVGAGPFDPGIWQGGRLHFVPDSRSPLIRPRWSGVFRNIYAPSAVELPDGWRLFYGAWDGVSSGNDRLYRVTTRDFLDLDDRRIEVEHGQFIHVCNVNAIWLNNRFELVGTAYPDKHDRNKPAFFIRKGTESSPHSATHDDLISIEGYPRFDDADMNGMNVLLHEQGKYLLYFGDFKAGGHVYRASGRDGKHFRYDGPCLDSAHMVNDVKKLTCDGRSWYLMGLHANTSHLWYSLSADPASFEPERELAASLSDADKYIVAIGWVVRQQRLLGFLYGAGAVPTLDRNRIFARWLQKKLVFTDRAGKQYESVGALGPDRQIISLQGSRELEGRLQIFMEDGETAWGEPVPIKLNSGGIYQLEYLSKSR